MEPKSKGKAKKLESFAIIFSEGPHLFHILKEHSNLNVLVYDLWKQIDNQMEMTHLCWTVSIYKF